MGGEWRQTRFGEICEHSVFGPRFSAELYAIDGNVATLRTTDISEDGRIEYSTMPLARLDPSKFQQHFLREEDLVITRSGRVGTAAVFDGFRLPVLPGAFLIRFRLKREVAEPRFYRYFFNSPVGQDFLISVATGSVQQNLNITSLHGLTIPMPPLNEQCAIAHILGTLDDKIELNRRMNETLEALARALFKSWFVDFDPVRAKMVGAIHESPLPKHILDLFPTRLVDSELGEIPAGWRVGSFREVVSLSKDTVNPLETLDAEFSHFSIPAYDEGQQPKRERGEAIKSLKFYVPAGAVLISKLNPEIERVWLVDVENDWAVCSTEFLVFQPKAPFPRSFVYCLARSASFRRELQGLVTGTSKSHQRAQPDAVLNLQMVLPSPEILTAFERSVALILQKVQINKRLSYTLTALRDTLLPKLISGELRVKDAERFIGRAS